MCSSCKHVSTEDEPQNEVTLSFRVESVSNSKNLLEVVLIAQNKTLVDVEITNIIKTGIRPAQLLTKDGVLLAQQGGFDFSQVTSQNVCFRKIIRKRENGKFQIIFDLEDLEKKPHLIFPLLLKFSYYTGCKWKEELICIEKKWGLNEKGVQ